MRRLIRVRRRVAMGIAAWLLLLAGSAVAVAGAVVSGPDVFPARTLVTLPVPIVGFAQDAGSIAWMTGRCRGPNSGPFDRVVLRAASGGPERVLASKVCGQMTDEPIGFGEAGLELAGTRALYWWPLDSGNFTYVQFATATPGQKPRDIGVVTASTGGEGEYLTGGDGDGNTLVYATVRTKSVDERCIDEPVPCVYASSPGLVRRVAGQTVRRIPGVAIPALLDVSAGRVAVVPAQKRFQAYDPRGDPRWTAYVPVPAAVNGPVEVRDVVTGTLVSSFAPRGRVLDVALDGDRAAVLVDTGSALQIEQYAVHSGRALEAARVPDGARDLDVGGGTVVYRVGNDIWRLSSRRASLVAHAASRPIGLSIDGRRIAWAENVGASRAGRIQSITLH